MNEELIISNYCRIKNKTVFLGEDVIYQEKPDTVFTNFIKRAYKHHNINYPKFYKMDNLSKLGFLTAELLLKNDKIIQSFKGEDIGIVILNSASSLDTDIAYNETIKDRTDYFPSPSLFVYTLPNIMIGEICIRHKITGENAFFIFEKFDPDFIYNYVSNLFSLNKIKCCITGWVDLLGDDYSSILYLVKKRKDCQNKNENIKFEAENIELVFSH